MTAPEHGRAVRAMFSRIAGRYDLMNTLMTGGRDRIWQQQVIRAARLASGGRLLDVGTGTGAIARTASRKVAALAVTAVDFTPEMMQQGRHRASGDAIQWCAADALHLPFAANHFDAVTSGYLMRNVGDVPRALAEQVRVVRPGGRVVCLDTSPPPRHVLRPLLRFFLKRIIPLLGQVVAGDRRAYTYLPETTQAFMEPAALARLMVRAGLCGVQHRRFMCGTIAIHAGTKPAARGTA